MNKETAKRLLDVFLLKQRAHWYKPIQIAEILYHKRTEPNTFDVLDLESYRNKSKKWRDDVSIELLGRKSTSSAKFQDNLFESNAIPPQLLNVLSEENIRSGGAVEAYIYKMFEDKHDQLSRALDYSLSATPATFSVLEFIDSFREESGLKRSLDKIYEIIVYALFSTLTDELDLQMELSVGENKIDLLREFEEFTKSVMRLTANQMTHIESARVYRVGVTNAADRGLDMFTNWGSVIQIKHLALDEELAEEVVGSLHSDRIVIVCKSAEQKVIVSLLTQIGWKAKIQSIITEDDLAAWYDKALTGKYSDVLGVKLLQNLADGILEEFPSLSQGEDTILAKRQYSLITNGFWS